MELIKKVKSKFKFLKVVSAWMRIILTTKWIRLFKKSKKIIFFIATPIYSNLGDQAIVYAQRHLLDDAGMGKNIVEVTTAQYYWLRKQLLHIVHPNDIIIIDGGGNMGTLWMVEEQKMRQIVHDYPQNAIFIFPQTIFFEDSDWGREEKRISKEVYCAHKNLTLFCRDEGSFAFAQREFMKTQTFYTPDMVMYLNGISSRANRSGVKLCLRDDIEKNCDNHFLEIVNSFCKKSRMDTLMLTTHCFGRLNFISRKYYLREKWKEFSSAKLVITDRLHGMIFSALTGTPCIALDNQSHKVKGGYKWISYLPYIFYCENKEELRNSLQKVSSIMNDSFSYDKDPLEMYFKIIVNEVQREYNRS